MRISLDISDHLLRRAEEEAINRGIKLEDWIVEVLNSSLAKISSNGSSRKGIRRPIPVTINADGCEIASMTNAQIFETLDAEDDLKLHDFLHLG